MGGRDPNTSRDFITSAGVTARFSYLLIFNRVTTSKGKLNPGKENNYFFLFSHLTRGKIREQEKLGPWHGLQVLGRPLCQGVDSAAS